MTSKPKWTDRLQSPIRVLNHADGLHLEKFTDTDLVQIAALRLRPPRPEG